MKKAKNANAATPKATDPANPAGTDPAPTRPGLFDKGMLDSEYVHKYSGLKNPTRAETRVQDAVRLGGAGLENLRQIVDRSGVSPAFLERIAGITINAADRVVLEAHYAGRKKRRLN
jgi:hypothetical protein